MIRLWDVPTAELLAFPGLLPLAILSQNSNKPETLRQIAQQIDQIDNRTEQKNVAAATFILAGLVLEKAVIQQILREDIVKESVTYQDILQQGLEAGRQQGLQQGLQRELNLLLRQLQQRLGRLTPETEEQVRSLSIDQLEALGIAFLDFTQSQDLVQWLDQNSSH